MLGVNRLTLCPLKDSAGLVKKYAFVSVENYQIVSVGDSVAEAEKAYYALLKDNGKTQVDYDNSELSSVITEIHEVVVNGNSQYYFQLKDSQKSLLHLFL